MCVLEAIATKCFENIADFSIQPMGADILILVPPGGGNFITYRCRLLPRAKNLENMEKILRLLKV